MPITKYAQIVPFITKDGSEIRELMHPAQHGNAQQSLAEAIVQIGGETKRHRHRVTEEIYHFTHGAGVMHLGGAAFNVAAGDTVCIPPGTSHKLVNNGSQPLRLLCSCAPAYRDEDTELLEE